MLNEQRFGLSHTSLPKTPVNAFCWGVVLCLVRLPQCLDEPSLLGNSSQHQVPHRPQTEPVQALPMSLISGATLDCKPQDGQILAHVTHRSQCPDEAAPHTSVRVNHGLAEARDSRDAGSVQSKRPHPTLTLREVCSTAHLHRALTFPNFFASIILTRSTLGNKPQIPKPRTWSNASATSPWVAPAAFTTYAMQHAWLTPVLLLGCSFQESEGPVLTSIPESHTQRTSQRIC